MFVRIICVEKDCVEGQGNTTGPSSVQFDFQGKTGFGPNWFRKKNRVIIRFLDFVFLFRQTDSSSDNLNAAKRETFAHLQV